MTPPRPRGRPPRASSPATYVLRVRLTLEEHAALVRAAGPGGVSAFVREAVEAALACKS